jgi:valyl-tRNA synthetase
MNFTEIANWGTVGQIIVAITGCTTLTALISPIAKFFGNQVSEWLSTRRKVKVDKELESHKSNLENKTYVSKVKFDAEFRMYQELSKAINNLCMQYINYSPPALRNLGRSTQDIEDIYNTFITTFNDTQALIMQYAPFITEDMCEQFNNLKEACRLQPSNNKTPNDEIENQRIALEKKLREYLSNLEVTQQGGLPQ